MWEKLSLQEIVMLTHIILVMALEPKRKLHLIISNKDSYLKLISKAMDGVRKQKFEKLTHGDHVNYSERTIDIIRSKFPEIIEEQFSGFYPFDVYFPSNSLVVEINGPTHFYDLTDKLLPKFVLKKRIFENAFI